jgi:hypothetical protein
MPKATAALRSKTCGFPATEGGEKRCFLIFVKRKRRKKQKIRLMVVSKGR